MREEDLALHLFGQFTTLFQISHVSDKDASVCLWLYLGHLDENSYSDGYEKGW